MEKGLLILIAIVGAAGAIALVSYIVYRLLHPRLKEDDKPNEEVLIEEEMNRMLKPVEDDKIAKEIQEYKKEDE